MIKRNPLCGLIFLLGFTFSYAQDVQHSLMPGTYRLNLHETPLYYIPHSVFRPYSHSVMHIQTVPFRQLQEWGTQLAVVSRDTANGQSMNSIVFLNAGVDTSVTAGFVSRQTEPLHFWEMDNTMQRMPTYGNNPFERPQNGTFNFQDNWFSLYSRHTGTDLWKDFQDESKSIAGTTLIIETAAFNLFRSIPFKRIIYNSTTDSIPLYSQTDTITSPKTWFQSDENLFVHADSLDGLWLKASRFKFVPYERRRLTASGVQTLHNRLEETTGWVRKEDRYRGQWEQHIAELLGFRFEVAGIDINVGDEHYTRGMLAAIKVIDRRSDQTVQVITHIGAEITDPLNQCLHFVDANFDGYRDIVSAYADGGSGPNYTNIFYLFDPVSKQFVYDEALSALSQVEVDTLHQVIRSAWRAGAGQHGAAEYRFIDGKMEQTYQWDQLWGAGYFVEERESIRQPDGQWKEVITYGAEAVADTVSIYQKPDEKDVPIAHFPDSRAYFKIQEERPLWYYVHVDYPDSLKGWIRKETVFPDNWKGLPVPYAQFEFEKVEDDYGNLLAFRIRDKKSRKVMQLIGPIDNRYRSGILEAEDDNRDGQKGFRIVFADERIEPVVYLFDRRLKLFVKESD